MISASRRNETALEIAAKWGGIDGGHHKDWVIDQMVRALTGCEGATGGESNEYREFVKLASEGPYGPDTYPWETGIAP